VRWLKVKIGTAELGLGYSIASFVHSEMEPATVRPNDLK
jgi:hypothetical protein